MGNAAQKIMGRLAAPAITAAHTTPVSGPAALPGAAGGSSSYQVGSPVPTGVNWPAIALADLLQVDATKLPLTRAEGMSVPAAARARHLLCSTVAGINLAAYTGRRRFPDTWTQLPGEQQPAWLDRADSELPDYQRMTHTVDDLYWTGFSLWSLVGRPGAIEHANRIERTRWTFRPSDGQVLIDGKLPTAAGHPLCRLILGPHEGLLNFAARTLRHASRLQHAAEVASANPAAYLELHQTGGDDLTPDERRELVAEYARVRNGETGGVVFTNPFIELKPHGTFDAHLLIDGRGAASVDVARASSVPASSIDATQKGASLVYQTVRDNARNLIDTGAGAYLGAISASLSHPVVVPDGQFLMFDLEAWLAESAAATVEAPAGPKPPRPAAEPADDEDPAA